MRAALGVILVILAQTGAAVADDLACVSTTFRFIGANDKVCVSVFDDPKVPGVACHISQARTGGVSGTLGLAEDPSRFSLACRQVGAGHDRSRHAPRPREGLFREHIHLLQAHARLPHRRPQAQYACLRRHQRQDHRRLARRTRCRRCRSCRGLPRARRRWIGVSLAPQEGFEPPTYRLTADCSTVELPRNSSRHERLSRAGRNHPLHAVELAKVLFIFEPIPLTLARMSGKRGRRATASRAT